MLEYDPGNGLAAGRCCEGSLVPIELFPIAGQEVTQADLIVEGSNLTTTFHIWYLLQQLVESGIIRVADLEEDSDYAQAVRLVESFLHAFVLVVVVNEMHLHRKLLTEDAVLRADRILAAPVEVHLLEQVHVVVDSGSCESRAGIVTVKLQLQREPGVDQLRLG